MYTQAMDFMVAECTVSRRRYLGKGVGGISSNNVGMSNINYCYCLSVNTHLQVINNAARPRVSLLGCTIVS